MSIVNTVKHKVLKFINDFLGNKNGLTDRIIFWSAIITLPLCIFEKRWDMIAPQALIALYSRDSYKMNKKQ